MLRFWLTLPIIFIAIYLHYTWVPTNDLITTATMESIQSINNNDNDGKPQYTFPLMDKYIQDTTISSRLSPFSNYNPSTAPPHIKNNNIVIVGAGLAGLSTAVEAVDQYYSRFEDVLKFFATNFKSKDYRMVLDELEKFPIEQLHDMITSSQGSRYDVMSFLEQVGNFKVMIFEKEEKIGGNSMKASSGINAVNSKQQKNWFEFTKKRDHVNMKSIDDEKKGKDDEKNQFANLYHDNWDSFVYDTLKSSISPEPPIWEPLEHTNQQSNGIMNSSKNEKNSKIENESHSLHNLLNPLSPYTPNLIKQVITESKDAINFLEKSQMFEFVGKLANMLYAKYYPIYHQTITPTGQSKRHIISPPKKIELFLTKFAQLGGHSHPRTHRPGPEKLGEAMKGPELPIGAASIGSLTQRIGTFPYNLHISVITSAELVALTYPSEQTAMKKLQNFKNSKNKNELKKLQKGVDFGKESHIVNGIVYKVLPQYSNQWNLQQHLLPNDVNQYYYYPSDYVVLATGGYSASNELISQYAPNISKLNLPTTNGAWAQGDAIPITLSTGGDVIGTNMIQIHPTSFITPSDPYKKVNFLAPEALRGIGGLLINLNGNRFVNELTTRDVAARNIYWQPYNMSYMVISKQCSDEFNTAIAFYTKMGIFKQTNQYFNVVFNHDNEKKNDEKSEKNHEGEKNHDKKSKEEENNAIIMAKIDELIGKNVPFDEKVKLIQYINKINPINNEEIDIQNDENDNTNTNNTPSSSPLITLYGIKTKQSTYQIIDLTLTMLELTKNVKNKSIFDINDDVLPLLHNVYNTITSYTQYNTTNDDVFKRNVITKPQSYRFFNEKNNEKNEKNEKNNNKDNTNYYYVALITPAIHFTMGGVVIDTNGHVVEKNSFELLKSQWEDDIVNSITIDTTTATSVNDGTSGSSSNEKTSQKTPQDELISTFINKKNDQKNDNKNNDNKKNDNKNNVKVIKGLYAAGEVSGGLHGRNRLGGNSLLECVAMGRKVAQTIVNYDMVSNQE